MLGGSAQSTSGVTSSIDFSPVIQFGEQQESGLDKELSQTQTQTPRQDASATASVGVGVGGDGSGGTVMRTQQEEQSFPSSSTSSNPFKNISPNMQLIGIGALALGGVYLITKKGKKAA